MSLYSDVLTSGLYRPWKVQLVHSIPRKLPPHTHPLLLSLSGIYIPGQYFPALITLGPGTRQLRTASYTPKFTKVIKPAILSLLTCPSTEVTMDLPTLPTAIPLLLLD